jgi:hypothetical protein
MLELSPDLDTLTRAPSGETEEKQQPRNFFTDGYTHFYSVIYITYKSREQQCGKGLSWGSWRPEHLKIARAGLALTFPHTSLLIEALKRLERNL